MALDKVVKDILDIARMEANKLSEGAEKEKTAILRAADEEIAKKRKLQERVLQEALRRSTRQEISSAELEAKRIILNARKEILDKVFEETLHEIESMPAQEKAKIYCKVYSNAKDLVPRPKVICPRGESKLLSDCVEPERVMESDMRSGLILESEDGTIRLDYRFKSILEEVWEKELRNISNMLFG
ncbi:MAG: V-type ATP synthase subunit E family protein [Methanomassiliicoccales archaeon]|nr:V-type ATP synthase subunit E family protein [Methanomassiliicoccales archaeon]